jgi:hypothetical protein
MKIKFIVFRGAVGSEVPCGAGNHGMVESCPPGTPTVPAVAVGAEGKLEISTDGTLNAHRFQLVDIAYVPLCATCLKTWKESITERGAGKYIAVPGARF